MSGRPEGVRGATALRDAAQHHHATQHHHAAQHHHAPPPCGPGLPLRTLLHRRLTWGLAVTRGRGARLIR
ncbi:hypothetical protein [Streptomyces sp. NPDC048603]|uniref:hypothetical protein n=1 Tax=Streptomyces sp. NPDC048603 TaxID=3365577 RepID=UPI003724ABB4